MTSPPACAARRTPPLQLISDDEYAIGLARLHAAADHVDGPVVDALGLLVLR